MAASNPGGSWVESLACACAVVTPGFKRAATANQLLVRELRRSGAPPKAIRCGKVNHTSVVSPRASPGNPGGATPTPAKLRPLIVSDFRKTAGSPPKKRFHNLSLMTTAGCAPAYSSLATKPVPRDSVRPSAEK